MRTLLLFVMVSGCFFSCRKGTEQLIYPSIQTQPESLLKNDSVFIQYFYENQLLRTRHSDESTVYYQYSPGNELVSVSETGIINRSLEYQNGLISTINNYHVSRSETNKGYMVKRSMYPMFADSIFFSSNTDTTWLERNSLYAAVKFKTIHRYHYNPTLNESQLNLHSILFFSNIQRAYLPLSLTPKNILKIKSLNSIPVKMPKGVLQDIFRLSGILASGNSYSQISETEVLFLEEIIPGQYPLVVTTESDTYEFSYIVNQFEIPEIITIQRNSKIINGQSYEPIVLKLSYPHE